MLEEIIQKFHDLKYSSGKLKPSLIYVSNEFYKLINAQALKSERLTPRTDKKDGMIIIGIRIIPDNSFKNFEIFLSTAPLFSDPMNFIEDLSAHKKMQWLYELEKYK